MAEYSTDTGLYKHTSARLCDVYNAASVESAKQKKSQEENAKILSAEKKIVMPGKLLPHGVTMVNAESLVKEIRDNIDEKKDLPSLNSKHEKELMELIKHTGEFKGYHYKKVSLEDMRIANEETLKEILEKDERETLRIQGRERQKGGIREKKPVEDSLWLKRIAERKLARANASLPRPSALGSGSHQEVSSSLRMANQSVTSSLSPNSSPPRAKLVSSNVESFTRYMESNVASD